MDDELLKRDGGELEAELGGPDAVGLVEPAVDRDGGEAAQAEPRMSHGIPKKIDGFTQCRRTMRRISWARERASVRTIG